MYNTDIVSLHTLDMLYLLGSHMSLAPTSVPIYHPLKGMAVNCTPPQSRIIPYTAGNPYQRRPRSANQSYLEITHIENSDLGVKTDLSFLVSTAKEDQCHQHPCLAYRCSTHTESRKISVYIFNIFLIILKHL